MKVSIPITHYNLFTGRRIKRLAARSDGVFAVAMTLLVLDRYAPMAEAIDSEADLWTALIQLAPRLPVCLMRFLTLENFLARPADGTQLSGTWRSNPRLAASGVLVRPLGDAVLPSVDGRIHRLPYRTALMIYRVDIALSGLILFATSRHAEHAPLVTADAPAELRSRVERRVRIGQALYASATLR